MSAAFLGLGSNQHGPLGSPADYVEAALERLQSADGLELLARSRLYRTAPWGNSQQDEFVNAVARVSCELPPEELLDTLQAVERDMGRQRGVKWGPRRIDLDILTFGNCQLTSERLTLPHPLMHERAFVLVPLLELEPDFQIPGKGRADQFLLDEVGAQRVDPL